MMGKNYSDGNLRECCFSLKDTVSFTVSINYRHSLDLLKKGGSI